MNQVSELFWNASAEEIKRGYVFDEANEAFICLVCAKSFEQGIIYSDSDIYYEAAKFIRLHINKDHQSMFDFLLSLDKKVTGLTELQGKLLHFFYMGWSDSAIVKELDGGSNSTIRNHRFTMREKMKQAKVFLAMMELVEEKSKRHSKLINIHQTASELDQRHAITEQEKEEIIASYFTNGSDGPLTEFPKKEKRRIVLLRHLMKSFDEDMHYTEKEVNEILKERFPDYVTLRRYLIEYGFMDRYPDGSKYWVKR